MVTSEAPPSAANTQEATQDYVSGIDLDAMDTSVKPGDDFFFADSGLDAARTENLVDATLNGADDGELFLEYTQSESVAFDDGRLLPEGTAQYKPNRWGLFDMHGNVSWLEFASVDPDPLLDPLLVRPDVQVGEELVRDLVFGMEMTEAVQMQAHRVNPEICSPPSTRMIAPLIQAASGSERR